MSLASDILESIKSISEAEEGWFIIEIEDSDPTPIDGPFSTYSDAKHSLNRYYSTGMSTRKILYGLVNKKSGKFQEINQPSK